MTDIPEFSIGSIELRPGDTIILKSAGPLTPNATLRLEEMVKQKFPGNTAIVLERGFDLAVMKPPGADQIFYGFYEDANTISKPEYEPPRDAPCLFCGKPIHPEDVRTHSLMYASGVYAKRSYFYRTHRSCAETDPTHTAMDGVILDMIQRNGD